MRVLLVDDDEGILELYDDMLKAYGFEVVCASDGLKAMELLAAAANIDIIVSDIRMPRMGGAELALACKNKYPGIPIILCSGFVEALKDCSELRNICSIMSKPVHIDDLIAAIHEASSRNLD